MSAAGAVEESMACDGLGQEGEVRAKTVWTVLGNFAVIFKPSERFMEEMF